MTSTPFGPDYADQYDLLYADKDYQAECDLLEEAFRRFGSGSVKSVLDMGCGTGGHAVVLAKRGYRLTGVDRSGHMLRLAQGKARAAGVEVVWIEGDIQAVQAGGLFDAVILMFAVLGYQLTNAEVLSVLCNAHRHLRPRGLLAFDIWYGPAVLRTGPADRVKLIQDGTNQLIRAATSSLDIRHHVCNVEYHFWRVLNNGVAAQSPEAHRVRFFFPMELELFLTSAEFELVSLTTFPKLDEPADERSWNAFCVARKID